MEHCQVNVSLQSAILLKSSLVYGKQDQQTARSSPSNTTTVLSGWINHNISGVCPQELACCWLGKTKNIRLQQSSLTDEVNRYCEFDEISRVVCTMFTDSTDGRTRAQMTRRQNALWQLIDSECIKKFHFCRASANVIQTGATPEKQSWHNKTQHLKTGQN